ncbi:MAG: hypothetical protein U1E15_08575 [Hyphomicrobiales bacterium]
MTQLYVFPARASRPRPMPMAPRRKVADVPFPAARGWFGLKRTRLADLSFARLLRGGRLSDGGRLLRYAVIVGGGLAMAWVPAIGYLAVAKPKFTSHFSLILPGAGAASSVNLADIGQASTASSSAYASSTISPTVTYKNLLMSANVMDLAAAKLQAEPGSLPMPVIRLVDETSFITVEMQGLSPEEARDRAQAMLDAFSGALNTLRNDEIKRREGSTVDTVRQYEGAVNAVREKISALQVKSGLNSVEQYTAMVAAADQLEARTAETEAALARSESSAGALAATLNTSPEQAALAMKLHADPQFAALADATAKAEAAYAEAGRQFGTRHPKVAEARSQFQGAEAQMQARATQLTGLKPKQLQGKFDLSATGQRSALMAQLVTTETERQGLAAQLASERQDLALRRQAIAALVPVASDLDRLNRDYKVAEAVFASALARVNTSKTDIFASYPMVQVTEAPVKPVLPSSPNKKLVLAAALASSLMLFLAAFLGWIRRPLIDKLLKAPDAA